MASNKEARHTNKQPDQKRQAPGPAVYRFLGKSQGDEGTDRRTEQDAFDRPEATPAACEALVSPAGALHEKDYARRVFSPYRESLDHAQDHKQHGGHGPKGRIPRQNSDQE